MHWQDLIATQPRRRLFSVSAVSEDRTATSQDPASHAMIQSLQAKDDKIFDLELKSENYLFRLEKENDEIKKLQKNLEGLRANGKAERAHMDLLKSEKKKQGEQLQSMEKKLQEVHEMEAKLRDVEALLKSKTHMEEQYNNRILELCRERESLVAELNAIKGADQQAKDALAKLEAMKVEKDHLITDNLTLNRENQDLREEKNRLESEVDSMEDLKKAMADLKKELRKAHDDDQATIQSLERKLSDEREHIEELWKDRHYWHVEADRFKESHAALEKTYKSLEKTVMEGASLVKKRHEVEMFPVRAKRSKTSPSVKHDDWKDRAGQPPLKAPAGPQGHSPLTPPNSERSVARESSGDSFFRSLRR